MVWQFFSSSSVLTNTEGSKYSIFKALDPNSAISLGILFHVYYNITIRNQKTMFIRGLRRLQD